MYVHRSGCLQKTSAHAGRRVFLGGPQTARLNAANSARITYAPAVTAAVAADGAAVVAAAVAAAVPERRNTCTQFVFISLAHNGALYEVRRRQK